MFYHKTVFFARLNTPYSQLLNDLYTKIYIVCFCILTQWTCCVYALDAGCTVLPFGVKKQ